MYRRNGTQRKLLELTGKSLQEVHMGIINRLLPSPGSHSPGMAAAGQKNNITHADSRPVSAHQPDHTDLSAEWTRTDDTDVLVRQMLSAFKERYPHIDIFISGELDRDGLREAAAALGERKHLVLSEAFLENMQNSQEAYEKGKSVLIQLLSRLSASDGTCRAEGFYVGGNEAFYWSAKPSPIQEDTVPVPPEKDNSLFPWNSTNQSGAASSSPLYGKTGKVSLKIISHSYNNLAGARTKGQVQTVMSRARRDIANLRLSACFGDSQERMKARAAISSMQKLLQRGGRKIRRLNETELAALRQKRAQKRQERSREMALMIERKKMEARRRSADECIRKEGQLEELNQSFRFRRYGRHGYDEPAGDIPYVPEPALSGDVPITQDAGATALTAADISISSVPVDISLA